MDPNVTLGELRELSQLCADVEDEMEGPRSLTYDDTERFVELFDALDGWMCKGGFSPWTNETPLRETT